jgi:hypothetical protein
MVSPRKDDSTPLPSSSNFREWINLAIAYIPTILKLLAALGLLRSGAAARAAKLRRTRKNNAGAYVGPDSPIDRVS